jgi:hypothetical protein
MTAVPPPGDWRQLWVWIRADGARTCRACVLAALCAALATAVLIAAASVALSVLAATLDIIRQALERTT